MSTNNQKLSASDAKERAVTTSIIMEHVMPVIQSFKEDGKSVYGTLWYVSGDCVTNTIMGPIIFDRAILSRLGYSDECLKELLDLVIKSKRFPGIVITLNLQHNGLQRISNIRLHNGLN